MRERVRGHGLQDLQGLIVEVAQREVRDDRSCRLPVRADVLQGPVRDAGSAEAGPAGIPGAAAAGPRGKNRAVGPAVFAGLRVTRLAVVILGVGVVDIQVFVGALREPMQLGVHVGEHPRAHDQRGAERHDRQRQGDAGRERAGESPGQGHAPGHRGSLMM